MSANLAASEATFHRQHPRKNTFIAAVALRRRHSPLSCARSRAIAGHEAAQKMCGGVRAPSGSVAMSPYRDLARIASVASGRCGNSLALLQFGTDCGGDGCGEALEDSLVTTQSTDRHVCDSAARSRARGITHGRWRCSQLETGTCMAQGRYSHNADVSDGSSRTGLVQVLCEFT